MRKIVCMSDLHEQWSTGTLRYSRDMDCDLLLVAGDITFRGTLSKYLAFNDWVSKIRAKHKIIVPGNHDLTFESDFETSAGHMPEVFVLNQESMICEGLKVYGEPRQPEFHNWAFNVPREEMAEVWAQVPSDTDILLTHGPPRGVGDRTAHGEHVGCQAQREWILKHQPRLVVCGHIHEGYGQYLLGRTLVINASICSLNYKAVNRPIAVHM